MKNIIFFSIENFQFLHLKKSLYIAWASFRNGYYLFTFMALRIRLILSQQGSHPRIDQNKDDEHKYCLNWLEKAIY